MSDRSTSPIPSPGIRWGAIAWGAIAAAIVLATLFVAGNPTRRHHFADWLFALNAGNVVVLVAIAIGSVLLVLGVLAALRTTGNGRRATASAATQPAASDAAAQEPSAPLG